MSSLLKISEAASLAIHAMAVLADRPQSPTSTGEIAAALHASENHLSKVLQRLGREGLVRSTRGPGGGFVLGRDAAQITLLDIYEAIEGPLMPEHCLFDAPICGGKCLFDSLLENTSARLREYLASRRLSGMRGTRSTEDPSAQKNREN